MKTFEEWAEGTLRNGEMQVYQGTGYVVQITQYSNKGPLFIVQDPAGQEISRARFDLFTREWKTSP